MLLVAVVMASACSPHKSDLTGDDVVRIGAVLPLSGDGTVDQGLASQKAIMLAVDELNQNRGNGNRFEVIFRDDRCDPVAGVTATRELIGKQDIDFLIGSICDGVTAAIMKVADQNDTIMITPGSTAPAISHGGENIYRFWFSEDQLGQKVAADLAANGLNRVAIIHMDNAWGRAQMEGVSAAIVASGNEVVQVESVTAETTDFRTTLLKLEQRDPDAYYVGTFPNGLLSFAKQFKARNINKPVYAHGGLLGSTAAQGLSNETIEGFRGAFVASPSKEFAAKFVEAYAERPGITADAAYDAVMAVASVVGDEGYVTAKVRGGLDHLVDYEGASGTFTVDENGDTHRPLRMFELVDSRLVSVDS